MNEALKWAVANSKAVGAARALIFAIARRARGCVSRATRRELVAEIGIHRSNIYSAISLLEELEELERVQADNQKAEIRVYHLTKFCSLMSPSGKLSKGHLCRSIKRELPKMSCDRRNLGDNSSCGNLAGNFLFPQLVAESEAREVCEECRGTGWRIVSYLNEDGDSAQGSAICTHTMARLVGRWTLKESPAMEVFLRAQIARSLSKGKVSTRVQEFKLTS